ncbi:MAG TPA: metallopeptidase TldD-related protein [Polyangia bacterium]|nr:metallopeptidase TldD-related protein [Polyangia bacterium]
MRRRTIRPLLVASAAALLVGGAAAADSPPVKPRTEKPPGDPIARVRVNDGAITHALQDELARSMSELKLGDEPRPYYLGYTIYDLDQATVNATLGAVTAAHAYRGRVLRTDVRVGDPSFDNTNFEGSARVETIPLEDDYAAVRRELWLRTDEAYKAALETLARKRAAESGQAAAADETAVGDFSKEAPAHLEVPFPGGAADPAALRDVAVRLSAILIDYPEIASSRVSATTAIVRRRLATSEGTFVDDNQRTARIEVIADTQAADGMKLRSFVPFSALTPSGLPAFADMEKSVRAMAKELVAMRTAPVASSGTGAVLFEGLAAPQLIKKLLGDQVAGTPPPKTAQAGSDEGNDESALATKLGQKVASPILAAVDDPSLTVGPNKTLLYGSYKIDDEGVPGQRVSLIEHGVLKSLLMSRTPRREITHSNGHARAPRFAAPRARLGTLVITGGKPMPRAALVNELGKIAKTGGVTTYIVRLLDDDNLPGTESDDLAALLSFSLGSHGPPPVRPLVVYRLDHGKETLVRGVLLENLLPRSLKDITAIGAEPVVDNYMEGGGGFSGVPSTIISPPLLVSDVDVRRQPGRNRKPPLYPSPLARH